MIGYDAAAPNEVWTVDFKGCFRRRCMPLTVRDACSRYVLTSTLCLADAASGDEVVAALGGAEQRGALGDVERHRPYRPHGLIPQLGIGDGLSLDQLHRAIPDLQALMGETAPTLARLLLQEAVSASLPLVEAVLAPVLCGTILAPVLCGTILARRAGGAEPAVSQHAADGSDSIRQSARLLLMARVPLATSSVSIRPRRA